MPRKAKRDDSKNRPYVGNYPPLQAWLDKHGARCMWQLPKGDPENPVSYVECWLVGKRLAIVEVYNNQSGWNIYTASEDGRIDATLADAEARLGIARQDEGAAEGDVVLERVKK